MVRIRNFRSIICWCAGSHAWIDLDEDRRKRCRRCGVSGYNYHWDWKGRPSPAPPIPLPRPAFDPERFAAVRERYGKVASWAVWAKQDQRPCGNIGDLSVFDLDHDVLNTIHTRFVLVALNVNDVTGTRDWSNFHHGGRDFMLRDALKETPLWGAYMTDIMKGLPEKKPREVLRRLNAEPSLLASNVAALRAELRAVGAEHAVLVAIGAPTERILRAELGDYRIARMHHYAAPISRAQLRSQAISIGTS